MVYSRPNKSRSKCDKKTTNLNDTDVIYTPVFDMLTERYYC